MIFPRDETLPPFGDTGLQTMHPAVLLGLAIGIPILAIVILGTVYLYWVEQLVFAWPGTLVVVRDCDGPLADLGVVGRFVLSVPFCVCVWRDLAPPQRRFRFYWLRQLRILRIRSVSASQPVVSYSSTRVSNLSKLTLRLG